MPPTKNDILKSARRILHNTEEQIRIVEWWNNHRLDEAPMDCEGERLLADLTRRHIAALKRDDVEEASALSNAMLAQAEATAHERH